MVTKGDMVLPTFRPCQTPDALEFYVLVGWPNGAATRINYFGTLEDAQGWIVRASANWLEFRADRHLLEGAEAIIPREVASQYLQAA
jgi:hypothetical protein